MTEIGPPALSTIESSSTAHSVQSSRAYSRSTASPVWAAPGCSENPSMGYPTAQCTDNPLHTSHLLQLFPPGCNCIISWERISIICKIRFTMVHRSFQVSSSRNWNCFHNILPPTRKSWAKLEISFPETQSYSLSLHTAFIISVSNELSTPTRSLRCFHYYAILPNEPRVALKEFQRRKVPINSRFRIGTSQCGKVSLLALFFMWFLCPVWVYPYETPKSCMLHI